ncbi:hypothetical protein CEP53_012204 [Fusarium sp. AF-6]|nr:hypothetical protein CEP53_012204 [Fusarium sp. AF-6]
MQVTLKSFDVVSILLYTFFAVGALAAARTGSPVQHLIHSTSSEPARVYFPVSNVKNRDTSQDFRRLLTYFFSFRTEWKPQIDAGEDSSHARRMQLQQVSVAQWKQARPSVFRSPRILVAYLLINLLLKVTDERHQGIANHKTHTKKTPSKQDAAV